MYTDFHTHTVSPANTGKILFSAPFPPDAAEYWSLEIHPWHELPDTFAGEMATKAAAIGEAGLDMCKGISPEKQLYNFHLACSLAEKNRKPLVLHEVRAFDSVRKILRGYRLPAILRHGWRSNNIGKLEAAIAENWYISCDPRTPDNIFLYFHSHPELLPRLALETDDSGAEISTLYRRVSGLLQMREEKLQSLMEKNFNAFLGI